MSKKVFIGADHGGFALKVVIVEDLIKKGEKTLVVVGNHDSLSVVKELPNYFELKTPYIMVANISAAPWFVKKMFIPGKLEELNEGSNIPMIYDFEGDMAKMAADPKTQEWWTIMEPMQEPLANRKAGEWWANMDEVFHLD